MRRGRRGDVARRSDAKPASSTVETLLLPLAESRSIVLPATPIGPLPMMVLSAAKGTAQIAAAGIARMREKANTAVATAHRTAAQSGMIPQDDVECQLILPNKRNNPIVLVPILAK